MKKMAEDKFADADKSHEEYKKKLEEYEDRATLDKKNLVEAEKRATAAETCAAIAGNKLDEYQKRDVDAKKEIEEYKKRAKEVVTKLAEANKTIADYKKRATKVETKHAEVNQQQSNDSYRASRGTAQDEADSEKEQLRSQIRATILPNGENVTWEDVVGLKGAKESLYHTVIMPVEEPQLFTGKRKPYKGILLYGPRGTGEYSSSLL